MKPLNVMLVDDTEADNLFHKYILEDEKIAGTIKVFEYAEDAIAYLKSENGTSVDIIFLDINMPRVSGFEFLEEFRALPENVTDQTKIVMMTTSINPDDEIRARKTDEIHEFITKPIKAKTMLELVKKYF